jgi:hypothetical protein
MNRLQRSSFKRFLFLSFSRESSPNPDPRTDIWDGLEAHHRVPLEHAHLFPNANPNRIANLVGVESGVHTQITNSWNAWGRALNGRTPTALCPFEWSDPHSRCTPSSILGGTAATIGLAGRWVS